MAKFILIDKGTIASEITPSVPVVICVDKSLAKWVLKVMNEEHSADKTNLMLKEDIKDLKRKITALELKLSRRDKYIQENKVAVPGKMSSEIENKPVKHHRDYKEKLCPGAGSRGPHMFKPKSGRQTMCDNCKELLKELKKKTGKVAPGRTIHTTWRGTTQVPGRVITPEPKAGVLTDKDLVVPTTPQPVVEKPPRPKVEDVLRMDDGPEKKALEAQFTLAEKMEASRIRYKIEREKWKAMRNRGFSTDNPILGTGC